MPGGQPRYKGFKSAGTDRLVGHRISMLGGFRLNPAAAVRRDQRCGHWRAKVPFQLFQNADAGGATVQVIVAQDRLRHPAVQQGQRLGFVGGGQHPAPPACQQGFHSLNDGRIVVDAQDQRVIEVPAAAG